MSDIQYLETKNYLYSLFYLRHTKKRCKEFILAKIVTILEHNKAYMKQK